MRIINFVLPYICTDVIMSHERVARSWACASQVLTKLLVRLAPLQLLYVDVGVIHVYTSLRILSCHTLTLGSDVL